MNVEANSNKIGIESSDVTHRVEYEEHKVKIIAGNYNEFVSETATTFQLKEELIYFTADPPEPTKTCCSRK